MKGKFLKKSLFEIVLAVFIVGSVNLAAEAQCEAPKITCKDNVKTECVRPCGEKVAPCASSVKECKDGPCKLSEIKKCSGQNCGCSCPCCKDGCKCKNCDCDCKCEGCKCGCSCCENGFKCKDCDCEDCDCKKTSVKKEISDKTSKEPVKKNKKWYWPF